MNQGFMNQRKTTFGERFDKAIKFYDFSYHVQKSTYKGLSSFYKRYSQVERYYADSLINLTKQVWTQVPELNRQNAALVSTIKQIINCMQTTSQLHFNYAERLTEVSSAYNSEYFSAKRKKDNMMKILKDKNQDEYNALRDREKTNRAAWNAKEKDICKVLYQNLDKLADDENERVHKIKQQTIIYFTLYKKVCQKQLQSTSQYNLKLVKQEIQVKNPRIAEIAQQLRSQFNEYGGEQMERKNYDVNTNLSLNLNRQSLRQSMMFKQRLSRVNETQNQLRKMVQQYQMAPDNLLVMTHNDAPAGLFDPNAFGKDERRKYSRQMSSQTMKTIAYDMIYGYNKSNKADFEQLTLLQLMKANLKIKSNMPVVPNFNCSDLNTYWSQAKSQISDQQYLFHVRVLQEISKMSNANFTSLDNIIIKRQRKQIQPNDVLSDATLSFHQKASIIDILLQSICISHPNKPVLTEGFNDYLTLISKFGENFMGIDRSVTVLLFLRKFDRYVGSKDTQEQLQLILSDSYFTQNGGKLSQSRVKLLNQAQADCKSGWASSILNEATNKLCHFYELKTSFLNHLKILLVMQKLKLITNQSFNARAHFYMCMRCAGFNYLKSSQGAHKIFDTESISGQERLKNIIEGIEQLDYEGIIIQYLNPAAPQTSRLLGVGQKIVRTKLFEQFTYPVYDFINGNLTLLSQQEGIDRDGYVLRLGIILAKLDKQNPQPITEYDTFFKVLKTYLQATEKDYDNMLQHSRKTQLWIMQQNALATPNCIDFCSLLYKPFEFLLISLKELQKSKKTQYTKKYSQFIKLRLNTVLKNQIIKYINFLYESLANYRSTAPQLTLKPKRLDKPHLLTKQQMQKERLGFKELTRRLFNLLFLKDQLEEMICDFLDPDVYKKLDNSIFNLDKLNKLASQSPQYRDILTNIKQIVQAVLFNEEKIVNRMADITVFHFMAKIFDNLYFQIDKNAIQEFFSNATDYKLSEHTFLRYQQTMEDWFMLIAKNIPDPFSKGFSIQFSKAFFQAVQFQVLNSTKFKLPFKQANVIPYLDSDVAFVTTMMKQKFFDQQIIMRQIKVPFKDLLNDLQTQTPKFASIFEAATLKNDKQRCRYILVLLNLRVKDERAMQFVKKYKTIGIN